MDIGRNQPDTEEVRVGQNMASTRSGKGVKPTGIHRRAGDDAVDGRQGNINMGGDNDNLKNPLSMLINKAKKSFNG